ncbi:uncharacterized oxidoreductase At4g09670-like [Phoenix dactylifera]|uniref:Uncharacterized oxidoreductase At4g09670-like n=1 Tax=Phoenix dactylifera TaxID=42345 RepID=A0A8B7D075_PHODC|nr:uncharacterized oxidoreductase At4g09670-like [Phoenix dactylifera]
MAEHPIRFGILGCANIARKLSRAISLSPNATVVAVGSRSLDKAQRFIADNGLPPATRAHGSYEAVLDDPAVDAVYVPLPTSLHERWAVAAAERGKHVLLEKPTALSVAELDRILEACASTGVQFMDGTMWLHHPRTARMKELLSDAGRFGPPKVVHSSFSFLASSEFLNKDIRTKPDLDSLGALGDLGWYCIGAILWAVGYELPAFVTALPALHLNQAGVILSCASSFHWDDGKVATFHCSFLSQVTMDLSVHGTMGSLQVEDLAIPYQEDSASFEFNSGAHFAELHIGWSPKPDKVTVAADLPQEALMVSEFARLVQMIRSSHRRPDPKWPDISRRTQLLVDAVKQSIENNFKPVNL